MSVSKEVQPEVGLCSSSVNILKDTSFQRLKERQSELEEEPGQISTLVGQRAEKRSSKEVLA